MLALPLTLSSGFFVIRVFSLRTFDEAKQGQQKVGIRPVRFSPRRRRVQHDAGRLFSSHLVSSPKCQAKLIGRGLLYFILFSQDSHTFLFLLLHSSIVAQTCLQNLPHLASRWRLLSPSTCPSSSPPPSPPAPSDSCQHYVIS